MRSLACIICLATSTAFAQSWQVKNHPNSTRKAILMDSVFISEYVYTEVSELSEDKAYVSRGELYAYINKGGEELTPYVFAVASNFTDGYAIVGDSNAQSVINDRLQLIGPLKYFRARLPVQGLIVVQSFSGTWGVYDVAGNIKLPFIYDLPPNIVNRDCIIVRKNEDYGVVNDCNEIIFNCAYQYISTDGLGYRQGNYLRLF